MTITIPALKLPPELILDISKIFVRDISDPGKLRSEVIDFYRSKSSRRRLPSDKNIFRAVTLPSMRHLGMIEGVWPQIRLTGDLAKLVSNYQTLGLAGGKRTLGRILYLKDKEDCHAIEALARGGGKVNQMKALEYLEAFFHVNREKERRELRDRLNRWLGYLEYVQIIRKDSVIELNQEVVDAYAENQYFSLSQDEFFKLLVEKYNSLRFGKPDLTYVPIPELRDLVCESVPGMLKEDFYEMLKSVRHGRGEYRILLSEPMTRQEGGLRVGDKYYYYVSIYGK